ncbi:MAG: hypothetical protein U0168_25115 [Nannocystaceae bacterium]
MQRRGVAEDPRRRARAPDQRIAIAAQHHARQPSRPRRAAEHEIGGEVVADHADPRHGRLSPPQRLGGVEQREAVADQLQLGLQPDHAAAVVAAVEPREAAARRRGARQHCRRAPRRIGQQRQRRLVRHGRLSSRAAA